MGNPNEIVLKLNTLFIQLVFHFQDKPHNPMLNSGAIMSSALAFHLVHPEMRLAEKFDYMKSYFQRIAGKIIIKTTWVLNHVL